MTGSGNRPKKLHTPCSFFFVATPSVAGIKKYKKATAKKKGDVFLYCNDNLHRS
jgi:hypothetical protein